MSTNPRLWRGPILDDATTAGVQDSGVVATTSQDNYFAVWRDAGNFNGGHPSIVARHFDTAGNPLTFDTVLNPLNDNFMFPFYPSDPAAVRLPIAGQPDGLAVAFTNNQNNGGTDFDIYVVRTNANLVPIESFLPVAVSTAVTNKPSITSFADGSLMVAYTIQNTATDWDIHAKRIESNGTIDPVFTIFNDTDRSDNVDLTTLASGSVIAVYQSEFGGNAANHDILYSLLSPTGTIISGPNGVTGAVDPDDETNPHVTALTGGGFVITWTDSAGDGSGTSVHASLYSRFGPGDFYALQKGDFLVSGVFPSQTLGNQMDSDVTALPDGGFVVTYNDFGAGLEWAQRFDASGNTLGPGARAVPVGPITSAPDAATLPDGRLIFTNGNADVSSSIFSVNSLHDDFNGNFTSDLLWSNGAQGVLGIWTIENGQIFKTTALNHDMPGWHGVSGDFGGDGTADLLWQNSQGVLGLWVMQDSAIGSTIALNHDMPGWTAMSGDFNGDGTDDLLWNNGAQGVLGVWQMQQNQIFQTIALNHNMPGWNSLVGDFNGDGTDDLLWNNGAQGVLGVWQMKDGQIFKTTALNHDMPGWSLIATGDYNHDGTTDLLWSNPNGVLGVWIMHDDQIFQTIALNHDMPGWSIVA